MAKDYYQLLGVPRSADEKQIKSAYRKLARKYHPDVNPGDKKAEERFKEVSEAHNVLADAEKRKLYDQFGEQWEQAQHFGPAGAYAGPGAGPSGGGHFEFRVDPTAGRGGGGGFETIFQNLFTGFGGGGQGGIDFEEIQMSQPRDVEKTIEVPLAEIDKGTKRTVAYQTVDASRTRQGVVTTPTTKRVEVTIPAGIGDGKKLRVGGKGAGGVGGKAGDLYVTVRWAAHPQFKVSGENLEVEVPVPFHLAALGGEISVPTLRSKVTMKIPEGTQSGQTFRLAGQGIAKMSGGRSDLFARIKITVPKKLTEKQRELLQSLASLQEQAI